MKTVFYLLGATLLLGLSSGCTTYNDKFKDKSVADIGMFADSTITMLSEMDLAISREDTILVRRFINDTEPEEMKVIELKENLKSTLGNMVKYSIEIVNIAEADMATTNKITTYANYLVLYRKNILANDNDIDAEAFDTTIAEVMQQTEFIEALRKAQPLLNATVMKAALQVDEFIESMQVLSTKLDNKIDIEYADIIRYRKKLEREKFDIMTAFEIIYDSYRMENPNLDKLKESGVIWTPEIIPEGRPTRDDLSKIGEHLHSRMKALHVIQTTMTPNWQDYLAVHNELDTTTDEIIQGAQDARIIMLTWVRAHQSMASGTTDPASWFDIGEVTKSLIKTAPSSIL